MSRTAAIRAPLRVPRVAGDLAGQAIVAGQCDVVISEFGPPSALKLAHGASSFFESIAVVSEVVQWHGVVRVLEVGAMLVLPTWRQTVAHQIRLERS